MTPNVDLIITDGNVGVVAPSSDGVLAIISPADSGPEDLAQGFTRPADVLDTYQGGPGVTHAGYHLQVARKPVVFIRCGASTPGDYSEVVFEGTGTVDPAEGAETPTAELDVVVEFLTGGTVGQAGITYRFSTDGGVTFGGPQALGTGDVINVGADASIDLGTGTVVAGDVAVFRTIAPQPTTQEIADALEALRVYGGAWEGVHVEAPASTALEAQLDTWVTGLRAAGKFKWFSMNTRRRTAAETRGAFLAAMAAANTGSSIQSFIGYDYADTQDVFGGGMPPAPVAWGELARAMAVDISRDLAAVIDGPLTGVNILGPDFNPKHHDEAVYPGADDLRFATLRTVAGYEGTYVTNPRLHSPTGSDYKYLQHIRVLFRACELTHKELTRRLSLDVLTDPKSGFILESEAMEIEGALRAQLESELVTPRRCSAVTFSLSRTDNVLATEELRGEVGVQFKGYPKKFTITVGARNPANTASAA